MILGFGDPEIATDFDDFVKVAMLVNIGAAYILQGGDKENLNMKSAFLHVLGDILGSVGAITAAILILLFGWNIAIQLRA